MAEVAQRIFAARKAAQITLHFDLSDEAKPLLQDEHRPDEFFSLLIETKLYTDAVKLLAHGMPKREVVWWACKCARSVDATDSDPALKQLVDTAQRWVMRTNEQHRRAAMEAAEKAGYETPAAWSAAAAGWSGGSLAPPDVPPVPPGEHLTALAATAAILFSVQGQTMQQIEEKRSALIDLGLKIANGEDKWPDRLTT